MATRFSVAGAVKSTASEESIAAFGSVWLAFLCTPLYIQGDSSIKQVGFRKYVDIYCITSCPVPSRRHKNIPIEPRHGEIRSIFLRLKYSATSLNKNVLGIRVTRTSNYLYESDVMSAYEARNEFSRSHASELKPIPVYDELLMTSQELIARRKLTGIPRSHSHKPSDSKLADLNQGYVQHFHEKKGK